MNLKKIILITGYSLAVGITVLLTVSCSHQSPEGMVIVTRVPVDNFNPGDNEKLSDFPGTGLVAVNMNDPGRTEVLLTPGFYSACSPQISYDATHLLFAGQKNEQDPWQVWEMDLKKNTSRQVTNFKESCFTPYYLPGDRLVFSREMPDTGTGSFLTLFTMNLDGSNLQQITFHPNADLITTILKDGRILLNSKQVYPGEKGGKYLAMRPNGTKLELFYKGEKGKSVGFRVHEADDGTIWLIEQNAGPSKKKDIVSIRYNRPLHSGINYTSSIPGDFYAVLPSDSGSLYVCYRGSENQPIGLYTFSAKDKSLGQEVLSDKNYHYLDPVLIQPYERPKNLPNELMYSYPTGLLLSQNINLVGPEEAEHIIAGTAKQIEILGMDHSLGFVPVEQDGSFFLKIPADMPFRIQTLDEHKNVVLGPSDWLWVRPFERRGCIGCHEDPELAPENIVPMAINYFPIVVPVDSTQTLKRGETFKLGNMH